jgi:2-hydroxy-3-oxopropionate reductase
MKIALLGVGLMGYPIGVRLCRGGHTLRVWNRTPEKARRLLDAGASAYETPNEAVRGADMVLTMLEDGDVVAKVLFDTGVAQAMDPGSLLVDMSSILPAQAREHGRRLAALHIDYLDAPVSGGTLGAEQGTLAIMVGGEAPQLERAAPALECLGRATLVGPTGTGQLAKLANQMIVGTGIAAVAEALLLCEKGGADMARVRQAITGGFADSRILQVHGLRMVERDFAARGRMSVQLKDLRNALATADGLCFDAPLTTLLEQLYRAGVEHGLGALDQSGIFQELARRNGQR